MANRYWKIGWSYGYAGTESEDEIDVVDCLRYSEKEVEKMTNEEIEEELSKMAWEEAVQKVDSWAAIDEDKQ